MSTVLDSRLYAEAVKAAVRANLGPNQIYEYGEIPGANGNKGKLPPMWALVSVERRYNPTLRAVARTDRTGWRVSVEAVGTTVDEARWLLFKAALSLNEKRLVVAGRLTTPIQFESDSAPVLDDERYSAHAIYTFAH